MNKDIREALEALKTATLRVLYDQHANEIQYLWYETTDRL